MDGSATDPIQRCFDQSYKRLVGQLYGVCGDIAEAEDVVAEAFTRAVSKKRTFEKLEHPEAWLRTVAVNIARTRFRRRLAGEKLLGKRAVLDEDVRTPELSDDRVMLVAALRKLPHQQREALALHYLADLSVGDVAATLGVPDGTVKARLSRGRTALAEILEQDDRFAAGGSHA